MPRSDASLRSEGILDTYLPCVLREAQDESKDWTNSDVKGVQKNFEVFKRIQSPYRKPTQVGGHKCAQVYARTFVKELGKKAAVTSG